MLKTTFTLGSDIIEKLSITQSRYFQTRIALDCVQKPSDSTVP